MHSVQQRTSSMEHKQNCSGSVVPPLSPKYPWFVAQNLELQEDNNAQPHTFFNLHDPLSHYRCKIPELLKKRIWRCFFGCWALLSSNRPHDVAWSLWNPKTSEIIILPSLNHRGSEGDYDDIRNCCLSAPPDHPGSVLLLTRTNKRNLVYCRLGSDSSFPNTCRKKELRWVEMTYAKQVRGITSFDGYLYCLTSCNGRVYAFLKVSETNICPLVVEIKMMDKYCKRKKLRQVVITLLPILEVYFPTLIDSCGALSLLKGSSTELFTIVVGVKDKTTFSVGDVKLFKLNMNSKVWEEMDDLKETIISVELSTDAAPVVATHTSVSSESGGYIHILSDKRKNVYSYHVKDQTISVSSVPCVAGTNDESSLTMLESTRLEDDHAHLKQEKDNGDEIVVRSVNHEAEINNPKGGSCLLSSTFRALKMIKEFCAGVECLEFLPLSCVGYESRLENDHVDSKQVKGMDDDIVVQSINNGDQDESPLLNIPLHVLETVMEFCVGVEYLKLRSTCKLCHLAAPLIECKNGKALHQLEKYSLLSPWLMVFNKHKGIITFTDPMFGDKYFIKTPQDLIGEYFEIKCSRFGWLLILKRDTTMVFFNPFTSDIRTLPEVPSTNLFSFSAPPTSPDCMVVASSRESIFIHFVGEPSWDMVSLDFTGRDYQTFTLHGPESLDLYAMKANGGLNIFKEMGGECYHWERTVIPAPTSCCTSLRQSFLVRCEQRFLQVILGQFGESVEVFKLNDTTQEWVKIDSLGKHMIFISSASPICIEAKVPEMENKIYFPRLSSSKENLVFYSLETCRYHTFNSKDIQENFGDFFGTRSLAAPHVWVEPNWC